MAAKCIIVFEPKNSNEPRKFLGKWSLITTNLNEAHEFLSLSQAEQNHMTPSGYVRRVILSENLK
jgi:hypothetical protein